MKIFLFSSIVLINCLNSVFSQNQQTDFKTKYVVILVIDGPRFSETYGDKTCRLSPILCDSLRYQGAFYEDFRNNGPTYTVPGHTAIATGQYQRISNTGSSLPKNPSLFQYYLKSTGSDKSDAFIVSSKGKLDVLANTKNKNWQNKHLASTYCGPNGNGIGYGKDENTFEKVTELISSQKPPHVMLINLLAVDVYGHAANWEKYQESITKCDKYAARLWSMIQSNSTMKDQTTLFITNDNGRHLDGVKSGFINHGDRCEGCEHISLLILGPDTPKNLSIKKDGELIDISKTIAQLLKFEMPTSKGRFLSESFISKP
ncbi:MAG: sulfatase-like hydrolase/transferase [Crocinitomicaceae bacterium]